METKLTKKQLATMFGAAAAVMVVVLICFFGIRSCAHSSKYDKYFSQAQKYYAAESWARAEENALLALDYEDTEECYMLLADIYYSGMGDIDSALEALYMGYSRLGSSAISARIEELKALKRADDEVAETVTIGGTELETTATAVSLSRLNLSNSDIQPLADFLLLEGLDLSDNRISDLSPISKLYNLETVDVSDNRVSDLAPLSGLAELKALYLDNNPITDFSPLYDLRSLRTLSIKGIEITEAQLEELQDALPNCEIHSEEAEPDTISLGGVEFKADVTELDLSGLDIRDISPLSACENLVQLDLSDNEITDLSPLSELANLEWLSVMDNEISDLSPLSSLKKLSYLDAEDNNIRSVGAICALSSLRELWLGDNPLGDAASLGTLTGLQRLGLSDTGLDDAALDALASLTSLTELRLEDNSNLTANAVDELKAALPNCTVKTSKLLYALTLGGSTYKSDATSITAANAGITSLDGLEHFTALTSLDLSGNSITNLSALSSLTGLKTLTLSRNYSVSGLSSLSGLRSLTTLSMDYCGLTDITALGSLTALTTLNLEGNNISDAAPLYSLTGLKTLKITNNNLTSTQIQQLRQALPNCSIEADTDPLVDDILDFD
jgi:Leucine-rich repeat (LRR) protein